MSTPPSRPPATPQDAFIHALNAILGHALAASGFALQANPTHQARGLFRFAKPAGDATTIYVEFQVLVYQGAPSRFRVSLLRNQGADARASGGPSERTEISLSRLMWDVFKVEQPESADHWWQFGSAAQLQAALLDAGKLLIGFGLPWLEGTLTPEDLA
jgi:hypothetical protein